VDRAESDESNGLNHEEESIPQGLKLRSFRAIYGTTQQLAEKFHISGQRLENFPRRLKPHIEKKPFTARVNSCPDTSCHSSEFFGTLSSRALT
jgi:hypothetical protein